MPRKVTRARKAGRGDATHAVHAGEERHGKKAPLTTEIVQTSVFVLPKLDDLRRISEKKERGYLYTRYANPTTVAAEKKMAALEGGECCVVTASGMAAILVAILAHCSAGDEIVSMLDVYGGTVKLADTVLARLGIKTRFVPFHELDRLEKHFSKRTRMLFLESPTNPTLRCVDIEDLARRARRRGIPVVVDNTFATPILQKPLNIGADVVLHSATKFLGGHSDLTAGCVIGPEETIEKARDIMLTTGGSLDPGASYLLLRGLKTLEVRVLKACENAQAIAEFLDSHPGVEQVMYPGLPEHAGFEVASRQMAAFGAMVAFEIEGGGKAAERFIDALELWYLATSLGGVESTVSYPLLSSHYGTPPQRLKWLGVGPATVRLSVGIEDAADLIADLEQALARA
ncbi:MAG TPA: aminotransferase class I/II-fold pyridoxal phosphate-dependent enzyme [Terriglobales bacterium]|nr:aminotransferase class I/II-fold pyridoxal phosphate-dependent enzyme [Terriglobales bacterium]